MLIKNHLTFDVMPSAKFSADIRKEFGQWMQRERENRGITQLYAANKMGITPTQLSRIENGKSGTERDTVIIWAQIIGIDENEALRRFKPENLFPEDSFEISLGITITFGKEVDLSKSQKIKFVEATRLIAVGITTEGEKPRLEDLTKEDVEGIWRDEKGLPKATFDGIENLNKLTKNNEDKED